MRRLAIAALSAATALSACTEKPRETSTEPSTSAPSHAQTVTGSCQTPFPLTDLLMKTGAMFSGASVRKAADSKIQTIRDQCGKGKVGTARHEALVFVDWMLKKYGQDQLPNGSALKLTDVISTLFVAVGFQDGEIDPGAFGPGGAAGVYDEDSDEDFLLQNANKSASLKIRAKCLPTSLITIIRLPDTPQLETNGEAQFPPFYDINAANADGDHTVDETCGDLLVGFCVDQGVLDQTDNPQIGHNKTDDKTTEENEEGEFEVLRAANSEEYDELDLAFCPDQANPGFGGELELGSGGGLKGLALSAWHQAGGSIRPFANLFLPQRLYAATLGGLGLGGGGRSISPFGVVDAENEFEIEDNNFRQIGSGEDGPYYVDQPLDTCGECGLRIKVIDGEGQGISGISVSVTLLPQEGATGTLSGTLTETTTGSGVAFFNNLQISEPGQYQLRFTAPSAAPLETGTFTVEYNELEFAPNGDPQNQTFEPGAVLSWVEPGCEFECGTNFPRVRLMNGGGDGLAGRQVTVQLLRVEEGDFPAEFSSGTTEVTTTGGNEDDPGYAEFGDLVIADEGTYRVVFSAPGLNPVGGTLRSFTFFVVAE
jgi:hypothetical protein